MTTTPAQDGGTPAIRPFADFLHELPGGVAGDLAEALHALTDAVVLTSKAGALTLAITMKPATKGGADMVVTKADVKLKAPESTRPEGMFFVTADGNLTRQNPASPTLPLRSVDGGKGREADASDAEVGS